MWSRLSPWRNRSAAERIPGRRVALLAILLLIVTLLLAACSDSTISEKAAAIPAESRTPDRAAAASPTATAEPREPTQAPPAAVAATEAPTAEDTLPPPDTPPAANQNEFGRTDFIRYFVSDGKGAWPFVPLDDPEFVKPEEATYLAPNDLVLGLSINGEHKAYPTNLMWFHHVANDTIGGEPVAVTY